MTGPEGGAGAFAEAGSDAGETAASTLQAFNTARQKMKQKQDEKEARVASPELSDPSTRGMTGPEGAAGAFAGVGAEAGEVTDVCML